MNTQTSSDTSVNLQQRIKMSYNMAELLEEGRKDALYCDAPCPEPDCENATKSFPHHSMQAKMRNIAENLFQ